MIIRAELSFVRLVLVDLFRLRHVVLIVVLLTLVVGDVKLLYGLHDVADDLVVVLALDLGDRRHFFVELLHGLPFQCHISGMLNHSISPLLCLLLAIPTAQAAKLELHVPGPMSAAGPIFSRKYRLLSVVLPLGPLEDTLCLRRGMLLEVLLWTHYDAQKLVSKVNVSSQQTAAAGRPCLP